LASSLLQGDPPVRPSRLHGDDEGPQRFADVGQVVVLTEMGELTGRERSVFASCAIAIVESRALALLGVAADEASLSVDVFFHVPTELVEPTARLGGVAREGHSSLPVLELSGREEIGLSLAASALRIPWDRPSSHVAPEAKDAKLDNVPLDEVTEAGSWLAP
jgi:hypothetical protein